MRDFLHVQELFKRDIIMYKTKRSCGILKVLKEIKSFTIHIFFELCYILPMLNKSK